MQRLYGKKIGDLGFALKFWNTRQKRGRGWKVDHICFQSDLQSLDKEERPACKWQCKNCGAIHNRDKNAAINILDEGVEDGSVRYYWGINHGWWKTYLVAGSIRPNPDFSRGMQICTIPFWREVCQRTVLLFFDMSTFWVKLLKLKRQDEILKTRVWIPQHLVVLKTLEHHKIHPK